MEKYEGHQFQKYPDHCRPSYASSPGHLKFKPIYRKNPSEKIVQTKPLIHAAMAEYKTQKEGFPIFKIILILLFVIPLLFKVFFPTSNGESTRQKVQTTTELIEESIQTLSMIFSKGGYGDKFVFKTIYSLAEIMNEETSRELLKSSIETAGIIPKMWKHIKFNCKINPNKFEKAIIELELRFMHDYALLIDNSIQINIESIIAVYDSCREDEEIYATIASVINQCHNSFTVMIGSASSIVDVMVSMEYGPWQNHVVRIFCLWTNSMNNNKDKEALCRYQEYLVQHEASWNPDMIQLFCWFSTTKWKCAAMEKIDMKSYLKHDKCTEFFKYTRHN